jgi:hypothetical protein
MTLEKENRAKNYFLLISGGFLFFAITVFAYLSYCSFPSSDDFIMANDTKNGFFWCINYWLGFWLSAWFTVALEVSIPLAFGYYDYGIYFFVFLIISQLLALFAFFISFFKEKKIALACAFLMLMVFLLYTCNFGEIYYWNIGALAYTFPFACLLAFIALHRFSEKNLARTQPGKEKYFIVVFLATLAITLLFIWKLKRIPATIRILDTLFPPDSIYFLWLGLIIILGVLIFLSSSFFYLNHLVLGIGAFLIAGSGPQIALMANIYFFFSFLYILLIEKKVNKSGIYSAIILMIFTLIMLKLPGTSNRMNLTHQNTIKDLNFLLNGNIVLLNTHFNSEFKWLSYLLIFLSGSFVNFKFKIDYDKIKYFLSTLLLFLIIHLFSIVLYYFSNGHFPLRLSSNFIFIYYILFFGLGITLPKYLYFLNLTTIKFLFFIFTVLLILNILSSNLKNGVEAIYSGEAKMFRKFKLREFRIIKNCEKDTCIIPYKNFNIPLIPNQEFIFPNEKGFVVSHKIFISRFFKKEYIRYDPATLPKNFDIETYRKY